GRPRDQALRTRLVDSLEQLYLVPFRLDHTGVVANPPDSVDALAEATDQLARLTADAPKRTGAPHRLGLLYERSGQFAEAAGAYRLAMDRLVTVDAWWCHRAAHEWAFRLAYVSERLTPSASDDRRLLRTVTPLQSGAATDPPPEPAGFFDAMVFRHGLQMSGFLLPGAGRLVEIHLDDRLLTQVRVKPTGWRPSLRYDLTHGLMNDFPATARLTVRAGGRPLLTVGGATALAVRVPGGTGKVAGKLARGLAPTKKGGWPRTGGRLADRQERYLRVYDRARELLDRQDRQLFLCYGTLLGCHREGGFIPGDDDFDVSYVSRAADPARFRRECQQVALELLRNGMDVNLSINGRLFKVGLDGVWIDVTPIWFYQGRAWAFDAHDLTVEAIEPVRVTEFGGRRAYLPADPEAFLADTYGPDWRTPQPEFRYYRSKADDRVLSQMWAKPSEVREFAQLVEAERAGNPAAGQFVGVGYPGYPGFSWLTTPDGPRTPPGAPDQASTATGSDRS
ncbi:MAG: LicD family protein, partial [Natronosporangium sp.]